MNAPERGALMLVRIVAVALIGLTALEESYYVLDSRLHNHPLQVLPCMLWTLPLVLGVIGLIKAKELANWLSDLLE